MTEPQDYDKTRWLSADEQADANDPEIGAGTPDTAPVEPASAFNAYAEPASWKPTRKWLAGLAGAVASVVASWIVTGAFDDVERGMVGTALVALTAAFFKENEPTPGGVPRKHAP